MGQEQNYFQPTSYNYGPQYGGACPTQPRGYGGMSFFSSACIYLEILSITGSKAYHHLFIHVLN
jgi:hypothetical protein